MTGKLPAYGVSRSWSWPMLLALLLAGCGGGGGSSSPPPVVTPPPPVTVAQLQEAARFSGRASFGMPFEALEPMVRQGYSNWIESQFAIAPGFHRPLIDDFIARRDAGEFSAFEQDVEYLIFFRRLAWWHRAVTADDQLRQRVAFALSQILVVSDNVDALLIYPYALSTYNDTLLEHAFGNYRDLLRSVSLHPAMGVFLSHLNNARSNPAANTFPDENYAREVMQLFSIGLFELNLDGSPVLDASGQPVPTYSNTEIREFAKIFTGLSYGGDGAFFGRPTPNFRVPMQMFDSAHEPGEKRLLNGIVVPAGQTGDQDIESAIDNLFNHPNVGPFIGKLLIQRLVTSNPSPQYVERVARAFNGENGTARGDMRAVIRAVLLDPEALASAEPAGAFGRLDDPVVRYASILRQFGAHSDDGFIANLGYLLQSLTRQHPLSSPSVFNFFLPAHTPPGEIANQDLVAPEFQIATASTVVGFANLVDAMIHGNFVTDSPQGFATVALDFSPYVAIAGDVTALVERLDIVLTGGTLDAATRQVIENLVAEIGDLDFRVRTAVYMVLISADYSVRI